MSNLEEKRLWTQAGQDLAVCAVLKAYSDTRRSNPSIGPENFAELWLKENFCQCEVCIPYRKKIVDKFIQRLSDIAHGRTT